MLEWLTELYCSHGHWLNTIHTSMLLCKLCVLLDRSWGLHMKSWSNRRLAFRAGCRTVRGRLADWGHRWAYLLLCFMSITLSGPLDPMRNKIRDCECVTVGNVLLTADDPQHEQLQSAGTGEPTPRAHREPHWETNHAWIAGHREKLTGSPARTHGGTRILLSTHLSVKRCDITYVLFAKQVLISYLQIVSCALTI